VYFIGKELMDNKAGILGAFLIAILPGQFLSRSVLGFADHHIAVVFFTALTMAFLIMAIKRAENITFDHWLNKDWTVIRVPIAYSVLSGISFGALLLSWTYGVFFAAVFVIFIIVQYIIDHFRNKSTEYLGIIGIICYTIAMIMVLPYVDSNNGFSASLYSLLHVAVTGGVALFIFFLSFVSREMNKREYPGYYYLLFIFGSMVIGLMGLNIFVPDLYNATYGQIGDIFSKHSGGGLTIAEGMPPCGDSILEKINCDTMLSSFGLNYYISFIALLVLGYYMVKKSRAEYTLITVSSIFILGILFAQNRFADSHAINIAVLSGFIGSKVLDYGGWNKFNSNNLIECIKNIRIEHMISLIFVIAVIGFLPLDSSPYQISSKSTAWGAIGEGQYEWHNALTWMKDNTPDPGLDYYAIYEKPKNGTYPYPDTAYGVMSWWDYGHIITYWGHRIPNANPFQAGIGGGSDHLPGASTFLIAPTEEEANEVLDKLGINGKPGARYVVSNAYMAYSILEIFAIWDQSNEGYRVPVRTSQGTIGAPSMKYFNTMEAKLHIFDTNGLHNYRLVHESTPAPYYRGGNEEKWTKNVYNVLYGGNIPVEDSGYAKIFEYVKGANITGQAPTGSAVTLTNTIRTNIGRTIQYSQTTTSSSGTYAFTVPYSTLGAIPGETQFDTMPAEPYTITAGSISKQIDISEKDVLEGNTVT
ncbi:MAG: oligosaccharyl transferase, archaeosortase A system-associated, partial [Candidatus Methanoperedens sp.]|nr:oligosaccharyl transferase, archaeosortase A system-associated [Candidatus Methanoperedens sp.]